MKATVTLGKPIPPPKPVREKKIKLEMSEIEAQKLYSLANGITLEQLKEIENRLGGIKLGRLDYEILYAIDAASGSSEFVYDPEMLK